MEKLRRSGIEIDLPDGWDGRIYRREAEEEVATRRALHAANFALPPGLGDYAVGAIERMQSGDVLVVLLEFGAESSGTALFRNEGLPAVLSPDAFSPTALPRAIPGRSGAQYFFSLGGRAFCLYLVLGSHSERVAMLPMVDAVVSTIKIDP